MIGSFYMVKTYKSGFSLMELMIVIAIMGTLAAVGGYAMMNYLRSANESATKANLKLLKSSIDQFYLRMGQYPTRLRDLVSDKGLDDKQKKRWPGTFIDGGKLPDDAWGTKFRYKVTPGQKHKYQLYSYGPNKQGSPKSEWLSAWD